jgi:hypothetical protein
LSSCSSLGLLGAQPAEFLERFGRNVVVHHLPPAAPAEKQDWVAALAKSGLFRELGAEPGWRDYAGRIIAALERSRRRSARPPADFLRHFISSKLRES